ncbi:acyl-CoA carboxylase subunit epsilon [Cryobacterium tepidiphilum]|uniref:Acyl-CoA carboxylase subunit epsilon n=1 Tax=Cryobacterium tepidiphilum TaxID=2486026 RepID=A0A3M8L0Q5_9MICO|nr:acyl-CoA carboxylase subunit epsilon [Cryobacterium tepidiphilum]RNE59103.1 acyl-CoA carboxylase subunit epsilon [Cryobacterium tepidiphilum]
MTETTDAGGDGLDASQIEFVTRGVTPAEVAAVTAVLNAMLHEQAEHLRKRPEPVPSRWAERERLVRQSIRPGPGSWRNFSG